ncbi:hypothetical protein ISS96_00290 [Candidatus Bathyarchaeota archaeon]|nr:hypothetical protein [Candidatus Bathyarchaeota archaeon]
MRDRREYERKYKRFVQGLISEGAFRSYLLLSMSKKDLIDIVVSGAKSLRRAVAIGEVVEPSKRLDST